MRRIGSSLRARVIAAAVVSALVVLAGAGSIVLGEAGRGERDALDRRLERRAGTLVERPVVARIARRGADSPAAARGALLLTGDLSARLLVGGAVVWSAGEGPPPAVLRPAASTGLATLARGEDRWRAATVPVPGVPDALLEVSASTAQVDATVDRLRGTMLLVGIGGLLVAGLLAAFAAGRATRSLGRLQAAADQIAAPDPAEGVADRGRRVPGDGPDEVAAVARALNAMLGRLERSTAERERALEATRRFAADAGHELRTPLAILQTDLETLARNPDLPVTDRQEIVEESLGEHRRLGEVLVGLQALTRGDGGAMGDETLVDLAALVETSLEALRREHPDAEPTLTGDRPHVEASPTGLRLLVDNLLVNAARHGRTATGGLTVRVRIAATAHAVELAVEDEGPGIARADRERVFERFARGSGPGAGAEGSGLGLAIVRQQAERLGGDISIGDAADGGARLTVTFPRGPGSAA